MIARGDVALGIGFARLAEMQEELLWLCEAAHVPVVWATEVLENLRKKGIFVRGEMTDAAMSGRAECGMLNRGPYLGQSIDVLQGLLMRMSEHQNKKTPRLRALHAWEREPGEAE
jgi:pyruvate kinase